MKYISSFQNPVDDEPLYKSLRRRTILEQKRRDNRLSDSKMRELILKLKTRGSEVSEHCHGYLFICTITDSIRLEIITVENFFSDI